MNTPPPDNAVPFTWSGRIDHETHGDSTRWHQHVRAFTPASQGGVTLIGFAVDQGVRRNHGRPGAAEGPHALRRALANIPVLGEPAVFDAGDITCIDDDLETAQTRLAERIADVAAQGSLPLVLGGGHEVAWGSFQGITRHRPRGERLLIVNLDAHFDLRAAAVGSSGTPFLQIQQWCQANGQAFAYQVFGISRFANTHALFERANALGVGYLCDEHLQTPSALEQACHHLRQALDAAHTVYLTICLDVLPGDLAPGVSAPAPLGVPLAHVEMLIDEVLASRKLIHADIAELNPALDRDSLTARVAARLVARLARGAASHEAM